MEKVRNFLRNYLESEKFFSKFSYFLERENFQNKLFIYYLESEKFFSKFSKGKFSKVKNFQRILN